MARAVTCGARGVVLAAVATLASGAAARAQSIEFRPECAPLSVESERLRTLVEVEATTFDAGDLGAVRIELAQCTRGDVTVLVHRDGSPIDARRVDLEDAAESVRMRLIAYVVAEILLASPQARTTPLVTVPAGEAVSVAAPAAEDEAVPSPADTARTAREPRLRPWHFSVDAGVRWFATNRTHVGTYRLTMSVGRMLYETRHSFGPVIGDSRDAETGELLDDFHVVTLGVGFRYRRAFGDDAFFVDGVGSAGFILLGGEPTNLDGSRFDRVAVAGLEARSGIEIGLGRRVRAWISVEFGYQRPRRGPRGAFSGRPEIRSNGRFLGVTVGLGWETVSGLRGMERVARRRLLGAHDR